MELKITANEVNLRIDKYLTLKFPEQSRSQIQKRIAETPIKVNGKSIKKGYKTAENDILTIDLDPTDSAPTKIIEPIKHELITIYEDDDILVVDKPPFIPVHPDNNMVHHKLTLINILLGNNIPLSTLGGQTRPGIVHRLDKNTSGLLIIAKTDSGYLHIRKQFEEKQIQKTYLCLNTGVLPSPSGRIDAPLARDPRDRKRIAIQTHKLAKQAISEFKTLDSFKSPLLNNITINLVEVKIPTGRTHQIRVHFAGIGHALLGDTTYGSTKLNKQAAVLGLDRQFLHACKLSFKLPQTNKKITLKSDLPADLSEFLQKIKPN